jgi:hypothetical protein
MNKIVRPFMTPLTTFAVATALLFNGLLQAVSEEPSGMDVRRAVENIFGPDDKSERAKDDIARWGNNALPHLKAMAMTQDAGDMDWNIVVSIHKIGSTEALDLLVEILAGKTKIAPEHALHGLITSMNKPAEKAHLAANPLFKNSIFAIAKDGDWLDRSMAAEIIAEMDWKEGIPLILAMLDDKEFSLGASAASALSKLTNKKVETKKPPVSFPKTAKKEGLLEKIGLIPDKLGGLHLLNFASWSENKSGIVVYHDGALKSYGADLKQFASTDLKWNIHSFVVAALAGGDRQIVALASEKKEFFFPFAEANGVAFSPDGKKLWEHKTEYSGIADLAVLYGANGESCGVVFGHGGEDGIIITDLNGIKIAQIPQYHVLYSVKTHPRLPHIFAVCGGGIDIFDKNGKKEAGTGRNEESIYFHNAEIFPSRDGAPSIIASASGKNGIPTIVRLNENLDISWKASVPDRISRMTMIESAEDHNVRVFAAASEKGEIFVFDEEGTLLGHLDCQDEDVIGVRGGMVSENTHAIAIQTFEGVSVFKITF